jgi:hypothetical protein
MATVGDVGAPSTNTVYYDALLATTMEALIGSGAMFDQIFKDSAFLAALRLNDAVIKQNGGERISVPILYGKNSTVKSYAGAESLNTQLQDGMSRAFFEWREIGATVGITRKEERQNSGEAALLNLLKEKINQGQMSIREEINQQLIQGTVSGVTFVPGNDAKDLNPLGYFLSKNNTADPAAGGNVGNISRSNAFWQHKTAVFDSASADTGNAFALSVSTYKGIQVGLKRLYNHCSRGSGGSPNLGVLDQNSYESYESSLNENVRYSNTKMADLGFDNVKLRGATLIWDELVPGIDTGDVAGGATFTGTAFLLNTNFYKLVIDSETDIVATPFVEPENQTVKTSKILFMANACVLNPRKLGVAYAISQSIVA